MKLLIITQKVNVDDPILGFFHRWIEEFAKNCKNLTVICLEKGKYNLPENVRVLSLGKEKGKGKIFWLVKFWKYIYSEKKNYDKVFVHMNPIYVVLGGIFWKVWNKKVSLWYTHKSVDWKLVIAEKLVSKVFTASDESFRLPSKKKVVTGHGIDTSLFKPAETRKDNNFINLISIGRIALSKNYLVLFKAVQKVKESQKDVCLKIIGIPILAEDFKYEKDLKNWVAENHLEEELTFLGPMTNENSVQKLQQADIFLHASDTGSLDKVVLEAMACGILVISSNDACQPILAPLNHHLTFKKGNELDLANKILYLDSLVEKKQLKEKMHQEVIKNHNLEKLVKKIVKEIYESQK